MPVHTRPLFLPALCAAAVAAVPAIASADENRRGLQIEGMIGASACLTGRVRCDQAEAVLRGGTRPSFATGAAFGIRPVRWFLIGGIYRWGMFNPDYQTGDGVDYRWGGQHTAALLLRPILPVWRIDLGLNIAPGYSRQVFRRDVGTDRDYSQGFAFLTGPTFDIFITEHVFLGAEVDFVFNTQRRTCQQRAGQTECFRASSSDRPILAPTHQVMFGLRIGGTVL